MRLFKILLLGMIFFLGMILYSLLVFAPCQVKEFIFLICQQCLLEISVVFLKFFFYIFWDYDMVF